MRVGIVIDWYLPRLGGAEVYTYHLAKYLARHGHEVRIFTLDENNAVPGADEFPVTRVPFGPGLKGKIQFYRELKKFLEPVDVIHAVYCHKYAAYVSIYNFFRRKPFYITLQGRGILDLPGNSWLYAKVHSLYRWLSLKSATVVIASCLEFVTRAKKYIPESRIAYIPNGVDFDMFKTIPPPGQIAAQFTGHPVVLTVRRLVPKNGIQFLVEAAPAIVAAVPGVKFVFVGYGDLEQYLRKRATELGVIDNIVFAGRVDNKKVPEYLDLAKVVVFPSTAESTSLACLEAMAMKKAIVASNVGGYPEMIDDATSGYLVKLVDWQDSDYDAPMQTTPERTAQLAKRIINLLSNPELATQFGAAAYQKAQTVFNWEILVQKIITLYDNGLKHRQ